MEHLKYPEKVNNIDSVIAMKQILDECLQIDIAHNYQQLARFCNPCTIPKKKYLTVLLHIGIVEVDIKHCGKVLPVIAHIGFR